MVGSDQVAQALSGGITKTSNGGNCTSSVSKLTHCYTVLTVDFKKIISSLILYRLEQRTNLIIFILSFLTLMLPILSSFCSYVSVSSQVIWSKSYFNSYFAVQFLFGFSFTH